MKVLILFVLTIVLYSWEALWPLKKRLFNKESFIHGVTNLLIVIISTLCVKVVSMGFIFIGLDHFEFGPKILSQLNISPGFKTVISLIVFDFLIWFQHLLSHKVSFFWRFHKVHHSDPFLDTSSALRFHPLEIVASMLYKIILITILGMSQQDFLIFEITLTGFALFNHSNIKLPVKLDQVLSLLIVTPSVHQVHHSKKIEETNSNYGFNIIIWDKIFKTYNDYYKVKEELEIGLDDIDDSKTNSLSFLLGWPLRRD